MARRVADTGDAGTNDMLESVVIRSNELQVWFIAEHVVDVPQAPTIYDTVTFLGTLKL